MSLFRSQRLQEEADFAAYLLGRHATAYYLDKEATSLEAWALRDGRTLLRVPRLCGLTATYYLWDGAVLRPITMED